MTTVEVTNTTIKNTILSNSWNVLLMRFIWRSMWEEVFCRFVVLFRSKNAKDGLFRNESTGCFHGENVAADTIHVLLLCGEKKEEIKGREGKVTLSAREKLKGMKYSAIKICREFFIHRIKHLYVPWKESEMKRETERERGWEKERW